MIKDNFQDEIDEEMEQITVPKAVTTVTKLSSTEVVSKSSSTGIRFMSRKEREARKAQLDQQEQKDDKKTTKEVNKNREEFEKYKYKDWRRKQEKDERLKKKKEEEEQRRKRSRSRSQSDDEDAIEEEKIQYYTSNSRAMIPVKFEPGQNKEHMAIKMQYLGIKAQKRKQLKPSEKFKNIFNFTWDKSEDTSQDNNPIYNKRLQSSLLFGRGSVAGWDMTQQKTEAINYENLVHQYDPSYIEQFKQKKLEEENKKEKKKDIYDLGEGDHWSKKKITQMSQRDWRIFREDNNIVIKGGRVPIPMREWMEYELPDFIKDAIARMKYKRPTPIQMQAIPIGMQRKDMIGIAPTGSGKSLAYLIPLISYLKTLPPINYENASLGPYSMVLLPARELAPQVEQELEQLTKTLNIRSQVIVGGRNEEQQMFFLQKGCEVIIGTPGRIKDAIDKKYLVFEQCNWIVLDEADKMMDLGLDQQVNFILESVKTQMKDANENIAELQETSSRKGEQQFRVTHLFSATFPTGVESIARKYLRSLCYIQIGQGVGKKDIDQQVEFVSEHGKKDKLKLLLEKFEPPIIIFANEKKGIEQLAKIIEKWGKLRPVVYHGSKNQQQREAAVEGFKKKEYDILMATDLAGRGLHVEGVTLVVNFDAPKSIGDFIHRTGRTGRAGNKGTAVTFITSHDEALFFDLNDYLSKNNYHVPNELSNHEATRDRPGSVKLVPKKKQILYAQ